MERSEEGWGRGVGWWGKVWAWKPTREKEMEWREGRDERKWMTTSGMEKCGK